MNTLLSSFPNFLKRELRFVLVVLAAFTPLTIFLDAAMGIVLTRDFGTWEVIGFIACVIFYAEVTHRWLPR